MYTCSPSLSIDVLSRYLAYNSFAFIRPLSLNTFIKNSLQDDSGKTRAQRLCAKCCCASQDRGQEAFLQGHCGGDHPEKKAAQDSCMLLSGSCEHQESACSVLIWAQLSFSASPPPGYTFIPAGDPQLTKRCKRYTKAAGVAVYIVSVSVESSPTWRLYFLAFADFLERQSGVVQRSASRRLPLFYPYC